MSRRTYITSWDPRAQPARGGRGRGRGASRKMAQFHAAYAAEEFEPRPMSRKRGGGTESRGEARFYPAAAVIDPGFLMRPIVHGRDRPGHRVGMFRNAKESEMIFGESTARFVRNVQKKIGRCVAPEEEEGPAEWVPPDERPTGRLRNRGDYYRNYEEVDEDEENEEPRYHAPHKNIRNHRPQDPYDFNAASEEEDEGGQPLLRRVDSKRNGGVTRRSSREIRAKPNFDIDPSKKSYNARGYRGNEGRKNDRRQWEREDEHDREEEIEPRVQKRLRVVSPPKETRRKEAERGAEKDVPARRPRPNEPPVGERPPEKEETGKDDAFPPIIASRIASRILTGLPTLRLTDTDGGTYGSATRDVISRALDRFMGDMPIRDVDGSDALRDVLNQTSKIRADSDDDDSGNEGDGQMIEDEFVFSHNEGGATSPVMERLFEQTMMRERTDSRDGDAGHEDGSEDCSPAGEILAPGGVEGILAGVRPSSEIIGGEGEGEGGEWAGALEASGQHWPFPLQGGESLSLGDADASRPSFSFRMGAGRSSSTNRSGATENLLNWNVDKRGAQDVDIFDFLNNNENNQKNTKESKEKVNESSGDGRRYF